MTIECYFDNCKYHSVHYSNDGPFCDENECRLTEEEAKKLEKERIEASTPVDKCQHTLKNVNTR
jgi:hypothetical protein